MMTSVTRPNLDRNLASSNRKLRRHTGTVVPVRVDLRDLSWAKILARVPT